jgi:hypothetical protein
MVSFSVIVWTWRVVIFIISLRVWVSPGKSSLAIHWVAIRRAAIAVGFGVGPIRCMSVELLEAVEKLLCFAVVLVFPRVQAGRLAEGITIAPACLYPPIFGLGFGVRSVG